METFPRPKAPRHHRDVSPRTRGANPPFSHFTDTFGRTSTEPGKGLIKGVSGRSGGVGGSLVAAHKLTERLGVSVTGRRFTCRRRERAEFGRPQTPTCRAVAKALQKGWSRRNGTDPALIESPAGTLNPTETSAFFLVAIGSRYRQRKNRPDDVTTQRERPRFF